MDQNTFTFAGIDYLQVNSLYDLTGVVNHGFSEERVLNMQGVIYEHPGRNYDRAKYGFISKF
ncbi:MAG: hypothetical protein KF746_04725 [Chitinophagaceae bacterium]|nr:hypothetical protein [Chitinophagaceae bacterium]